MYYTPSIHEEVFDVPPILDYSVQRERACPYLTTSSQSSQPAQSQSHLLQLNNFVGSCATTDDGDLILDHRQEAYYQQDHPYTKESFESHTDNTVFVRDNLTVTSHDSDDYQNGRIPDVTPQFPPQTLDIPDINLSSSVLSLLPQEHYQQRSKHNTDPGAYFGHISAFSTRPITAADQQPYPGHPKYSGEGYFKVPQLPLGGAGSYFHPIVHSFNPYFTMEGGVVSPGDSAHSSPSRPDTSEDSDDSLPLSQLAGPGHQKATGSPVSVTETNQPGKKKRGWTSKRKKKKDPNEPQKPVSAYALFFRDTQAAIKGQNPSATFGEISKIVASMWDNLDPDSKNVYKQRTETAKKEYLKLLAAYRATQVSQEGAEFPNPPVPKKKKLAPVVKQVVVEDEAMAAEGEGEEESGEQRVQDAAQDEKPEITFNQPVSIQVPQQQQQQQQQLHPKRPAAAKVVFPGKDGKPITLTLTPSSLLGNRNLSQVLPKAEFFTNQQENLPAEGTEGGVGVRDPSLGMKVITTTSGKITKKIIQVHVNPDQLKQFQSIAPKTTTTISEPQQVLASGGQNENQIPVPEPPKEEPLPPPLCLRDGCNNPSIENPQWDQEYCSSQCVVSHCRDVFTAWVAARQTSYNQA